jgi:alpha-amylase/alpha-mannosidase (GH57 family)
MTDNPLHVAFLWHMHQPFYKDPMSGLYRLPWVRLHGTKDYLDMAKILEDFPDIRQTFNFTPSLLEQIKDYTEADAKDYYLELTLKKASDLDTEEKTFILENFFLANWDNMIKPFPRYYDLLVKRGLRHLTKSDLVRETGYFSDRDFLDLQVLFNLSWIDPMFRQTDPELKTFAEKGMGYTEEEKLVVVKKQFAIMEEIIPTYRKMRDNGQVELSASPFYHPILPLLCDTNSARVAMPDAKLPRERFSHPEDAEKQIRTGLDYFEKVFGQRPAGMWPSEGSVSDDVLKIASSAGIKWLATDEDILSISIGKQLRDGSRNVTDPAALYRAYSRENVCLIFRDHNLSDLIGFVYSKWEPKVAAEDFIGNLLRIRHSLPGNRAYLVSIILDGENAWEYYRNDGLDFLRYLYEGLSQEKRLKTVTVSDYLSGPDECQPLERLHAGSWIYANFGIWIGHEEDNTAWDYLKETRDELELFQKRNPGKDLSDAWKSIYIAEGSDWNWWYGDEHATDTQEVFDELFRTNLIKVYARTGTEAPPHLYVPILREDKSIAPSVVIRGFIEPRIDGLVTSYYEWYQGARVDIKKSGGSMHKAESILSALYYGFNKDNLFLRLDPAVSFSDLFPDTKFSINFTKPSQLRVTVSLKPVTAELLRKTDKGWQKIKDIPDAAVQDIFELEIPFNDLAAHEKEEIVFSISILKHGEEIERCPSRGYVSLTVPTPDFESMMWY